MITELVKKAEDKITIMQGSGINEKNLSNLMYKRKAIEFKSSAKGFGNGKTAYQNDKIKNIGNYQ